MSLIQDLGARLRATSDELPTGQVTVALEKLRSATELLTWVRETSQDPLGVPQLGNATEHAERAAAALRLAQDSIARYLASIGLSGEGAAPPDRDWKAGLEKPDRRPDEPETQKTEQLGPWWQARVTQLTGESPPDKTGNPEMSDAGGGAGGGGRGASHAGGDAGRAGGGRGSGGASGGRGGGAADTAELLRRVASGVRAGDRARLGRELHAVNASTGLGLSAVSSPLLHRLAGDLLGHEPRPDDVPKLRSAAEGRVKSLLPGTSPAVLQTLIDRICRVPVAEQPKAPTHPADSAVTAGVLTGVLLARLGRDAGSLDPSAPDPVRRPAEDTGRDHG